MKIARSIGIALLIAGSTCIANTAHAQNAIGSADLSSPVSGAIYTADAAGACYINVTSSSDHNVDFSGPINGTITWHFSIFAFSDGGLVSFKPPKGGVQQTTDTTGSQSVNLAAGQNILKYSTCNAVAIYNRYAHAPSANGEADAYAFGDGPGVPSHDPTTHKVFYTVQYP